MDRSSDERRKTDLSSYERTATTRKKKEKKFPRRKESQSERKSQDAYTRPLGLKREKPADERQTIQGTKLLDQSTRLALTLMDSRHVLIRPGSEYYYTRLWTKRSWYINGYPMRMLKWTPDFHPDTESSIAFSLRYEICITVRRRQSNWVKSWYSVAELS
ncbi:ethylene-dependent gravitropism-deficient andyellow-green-like 2 [Striga asiatica]|uniref:Ethylene-dependent gravitropism-deficient andyellow-green-like 2 n=1 Tax=Striga asiatica TaxID=4170 RepID=A0A5A7PZF7_STRAF|nr:ethylene-dependent gravitropism-deficient andyellow-green-like 2 [Striga asiatica]